MNNIISPIVLLLSCTCSHAQYGITLYGAQTDANGNIIGAKPINADAFGNLCVSITTNSPQTLIVADAWVRPNNTTAYQANDAMCQSEIFTNCPRPIGLLSGRTNISGRITGVSLFTNSTNMSASLRVWFYNATNAVQADNALFNIAATNYQYTISYVDLLFANTGIDGAYYQNINDAVTFKTYLQDTNIYYALQTLTGFIPLARQTNMLTFTIVTQ